MRLSCCSLLAILIVLGHSCKNKVEDVDIPEISPEYFIDKTFVLSQFTEDISYIRLDSIFQIKKTPVIRRLGDKLLIYTEEEGCMMYDMQGNYMHHIAKRGGGPGEFRNGRRVKVDAVRRHIYINDFHKTIVKDYKGNLIREIKKREGKFNSTNMQVIHENNNIKLVFGGYLIDDHKWIITDSVGNIEYIEKQVSMSKEKFGRFFCEVSYNYDGKFHYWNELNDTIYCLEGKEYIAKYLFKKDKYRFTGENINVLKSGKKSKALMRMHAVYETDQYLILTYKMDFKFRLCIYDKSMRKFYNNDYSNNNRHYLYLLNDIDGGVPFLLSNYHVNNGNEYFAASIDAFSLKEHVNSKEFEKFDPRYPEKKKELKKLAESLEETDNPVIMLVKLKQ